MLRLMLMASPFAIALLAVVTFGAAAQNVPWQKKPYVRTGEEATILGKVMLSGERPKPTVIDMTADPGCYKDNPRPKTEWYEGRAGGLANVFVYVTSNAFNGYVFETPTSPVVWDQKGCRYVPRVLGMQLGQTLSITNSDATMNNVHPTPKFNPEWNQTQAVGSPPLLKILRHAEVAIPFWDNQHPWKKGYVSVFTHPFFAVTDMEGNYRIQGLPPGAYKLTAWHKRLGEKTFDLMVMSGESRSFGFTFRRLKRTVECS